MRLSFLICLFCFHCAAGNLKIQVQRDGSGRITVLERKVTHLPIKQPPAHWRVKAESVHKLEIIERVYSFDNFQTVTLPGLGMREYKELDEADTTYIVYFDTSKQSPLIAFLNVDQDNNTKILEEAKKRDDLLRFNTLTDHLVFEFHLPWEVKSAKFSEQRDLTEWGIRVESQSKVVVKLPLADLYKDKFKTSEVKILLQP